MVERSDQPETEQQALSSRIVEFFSPKTADQFEPIPKLYLDRDDDPDGSRTFIVDGFTTEIRTTNGYYKINLEKRVPFELGLSELIRPTYRVKIEHRGNGKETNIAVEKDEEPEFVEYYELLEKYWAKQTKTLNDKERQTILDDFGKGFRAIER